MHSLWATVIIPIELGVVVSEKRFPLCSCQALAFVYYSFIMRDEKQVCL